MDHSQTCKKTVFVLKTMVLGGIEKSFLDLCWLLPRDQYEITVILYEKRGELLDELPEWVTVKTLPLSVAAQYELLNGRVPCLKWCLTHFHWGHAFRMIAARIAWQTGRHDYTFDFPALSAILKATPDIFHETFDLAVAYFGDDTWAPCVALDYLKARKKICWTHSENPYFQMSKALQRTYYSRFDYRCACSKATALRINNALEISDLVKGVPHVVNPDKIRKDAEAEKVCQKSKDLPVILTVGRLAEQKGIDIAIRVHKKLLERGCLHHWYVVGNVGKGDNTEQKLREMIRDFHVEDSFFLEGGKLNPYPYFKRCDIYVQPSRFEGYCLTVAEARSLTKPIVATDFDGAREQLKDGLTGLIVACEETALTSAVQRLYDDKSLREFFSKNLEMENIDTCRQVLDVWKKMSC